MQSMNCRTKFFFRCCKDLGFFHSFFERPTDHEYTMYRLHRQKDYQKHLIIKRTVSWQFTFFLVLNFITRYQVGAIHRNSTFYVQHAVKTLLNTVRNILHTWNASRTLVVRHISCNRALACWQYLSNRQTCRQDTESIVHATSLPSDWWTKIRNDDTTPAIFPRLDALSRPASCCFSHGVGMMFKETPFQLLEIFWHWIERILEIYGLLVCKNIPDRLFKRTRFSNWLV